MGGAGAGGGGGGGCSKRLRYGGRSTAVLFLLVVVIVVVVALAQLPTADASISLNLKSSVLSNILSPTKSSDNNEELEGCAAAAQGTTSTGGGGGRSGGGTGGRSGAGGGTSSTNSAAAAARKRPDDKESSFLRLDLSGRAHCHLMGPSSFTGDTDDQNALSSTSTASSSLTPLMTTRPILQTAAGSALSVVVGADYDFSQRWYGATRLLTSLGWRNRSRNRSRNRNRSRKQQSTSLSTTTTTSTTKRSTSSIDHQDEDRQGYDNVYHPSAPPPAFVSSTAAAAATVDIKKPGFWSRLVPAGVKVQAEHCLQDDREFAAQVAVDWEHPHPDPDDVTTTYSREGRPSIQARIDSTGKTEASVQVPLHHQRLQVQWKVSTINDGVPRVPHQPESEEGSTAAKQSGGTGSTSGDENAWWMPDVRIDALGRMESKNEAWLPSPIFGPGGRVGLRLFVSRRLNWNAMGFANDNMESQTLLKLEVQAVSGGSSRGVLQQDTDADTDTTNYLQFLQGGKSITTARLETELERPVSAARLFLLQEHALGGNAP